MHFKRPGFVSVVVGRPLHEEVERLLKLLEGLSPEQNLPQNFAADAVKAVHLAVRCGGHNHLEEILI